GVDREARRSELAFQRAGELVEVLVDDGDLVEKEELLARLDSRHTKARQAQLMAGQAEAQAVLDELLAGPRVETIAAKRADLRSRQAERDTLSSQVRRREKLVSGASISREEYETLNYELAAAVARVDVVQRQLDEMLAGVRPEKIAAQRARLAQIDASLADVAHDLADAELTAPFSGRISRRIVDEGAVLSTGAPVVEIVEVDRLEVRIGLPPQSVARLAIGDAFTLDADDRSVTATVQAIGPEVSLETRTRDVVLSVVASAGAPTLLPGQIVRLAFEERIDQSGAWLPTTALTQADRGLWAVYVVERREDGAEAVARRDVELLDTEGDRSFVRGLLRDGDAVIASGAHRVVVGQRIEVEASGEAPAAL
ncbi:MAG: efflux RND transporter periplasmic adaptor subunit, partial [Planctomycetota bacterium]